MITLLATQPITWPLVALVTAATAGLVAIVWAICWATTKL